MKELVGPLHHEGLKVAIKEDKGIVEKLNDVFALVFTAEDAGERPTPDLLFSGTMDQVVSENEVSGEQVLEQTDNFKKAVSHQAQMLYPRVRKEQKCEVAELLAKI